MLFNLQTFLHKQNRFVSGQGRVVDNRDPLKLGHIKAQITGQLEGAPSDLPWICPVQNAGLGHGGSSSVCVPDIDSLVWVVWDSPYYPQYIGQVPSTQHSAVESLLESYPMTYGWSDKELSLWRNRQSGDVCLKYLETVVTLKKDGSAHLNVPGGITWTTEDLNLEAKNITISGENIKINGSGGLNLESGGETTVRGSMIKLN